MAPLQSLHCTQDRRPDGEWALPGHKTLDLDNAVSALALQHPDRAPCALAVAGYPWARVRHRVTVGSAVEMVLVHLGFEGGVHDCGCCANGGGCGSRWGRGCVKRRMISSSPSFQAAVRGRRA